MENMLDLHTKVKQKSGLTGSITAISQEVPFGTVQYLVKYVSKDGELETRWMTELDFDVIE